MFLIYYYLNIINIKKEITKNNIILNTSNIKKKKFTIKYYSIYQ